jgi:hypothetical protein
MTDLNSLMIFAKVVEANSFSEASRPPFADLAFIVIESVVQIAERLGQS